MRGYDMSLEEIERKYGCVAEYNRCMEEEDNTDYERFEKQNLYEKANLEKIDEAKKNGTLVTYCDECYGCEFYEDIGSTHMPRHLYDYIDDVPHGVCHNLEKKDCAFRKSQVSDIDSVNCGVDDESLPFKEILP